MRENCNNKKVEFLDILDNNYFKNKFMGTFIFLKLA